MNFIRLGLSVLYLKRCRRKSSLLRLWLSPNCSDAYKCLKQITINKSVPMCVSGTTFIRYAQIRKIEKKPNNLKVDLNKISTSFCTFKYNFLARFVC